MTTSDTLLQDVFTTALEGGIGYWSEAETYHWSDEDPASFYSDIVDVEDDYAEYHIDIHTIRRGIAYLLEHLPASDYQRLAVLGIAQEWEDVDFDADTADFIVQAGLFGEVVYG